LPFPESSSGYDKLSVNGRRYSGTSLLGETFTAWTDLTWRSDESVVERGWQFCLIHLTCAMDGLKTFAIGQVKQRMEVEMAEFG